MNVNLKDTLKLGHTMGDDRETGFNTEVLVVARGTGVTDGIQVYENNTALPGRIQIIENFFGLDVTELHHKFLNDNILGTLTDPVSFCADNPDIRPKNNPNMFRMRSVGWWCAGNGCENKTVEKTLYDTHNTNNKLYNIMPFRLIKASETLPPEQRDLYKGEAILTINGEQYKGYFFKKLIFSGGRKLNLMLDGVPHEPKFSNSVPLLDQPQNPPNDYKGNKLLQSYTDLRLEVNELEFKEWFMALDNSLFNASISEVGLVTGLECNRLNGINGVITPQSSVEEKRFSEVFDAELASHLGIGPYLVSKDSVNIGMRYRVFS